MAKITRSITAWLRSFIRPAKTASVAQSTQPTEPTESLAYVRKTEEALFFLRLAQSEYLAARACDIAGDEAGMWSAIDRQRVCAIRHERAMREIEGAS